MHPVYVDFAIWALFEAFTENCCASNWNGRLSPHGPRVLQHQNTFYPNRNDYDIGKFALQA
jgi:hypothetical protein